MSDPALSTPSFRRISVLPPEGWRFTTAEEPGAANPGHPDHDWSVVTVPHTWNAVDGASGGDPTGKNRTGYRRGPAWYRQRLDVPDASADRRYFLRFEGASQFAEVFVNGCKVGSHVGSFTAFCLEITAQVMLGENLLAIRVDNSWDPDTPPLEGDFVVFGGLYRPVHLLTTGQLCLSPLRFSGPGVYAVATLVSPDSATLNVCAILSDTRTNPGHCTVRVQLLDAAGQLIAEGMQNAGPGQEEVGQVLKVARPRLWDGLRDPYLYRVRVELLDQGECVDQVEVSCGFRSFAFGAGGEFLLNGNRCRLAGVNRHQDREGRGWALTDDDHLEDFALIREIGANAVRLAHYPQADYFFELCDRAGLLVWVEIPLVNLISDTPAFAGNCRQQLGELIHQQFNRTGIFAWGIWNELGMSEGPDPESLIRSLHAFARAADPSRPTVAAAFGQTYRCYPSLVGLTDQIAWNEYPGWYGTQSPSHLGEVLDGLHQRVPGKGLAISEYGAGASIQHHSQDLTQAPPPNGRWHPEEWQAFVHEETWKEIALRPYVWGSFVWNLCDFASAMRSEGDRDGINDKGLVTFDRQTRKDAFFFYKSAWSAEPVLYLTSRRHRRRTEPATPVKAYCNAGPVTLRINGLVQSGPAVDGVIHCWPRILLRPGDNLIEVEAEANGRRLYDHCTWSLEAAPR